MKKLLLLCLTIFSLTASAQSDYYTVLSNNGGTSQNGRAPQGTSQISRGVWLISAAEMAASGFGTGNVVNSLGFNLFTAQDIATTGTMVVYLQNTTDATNLKSTTWATAITGMTTASNSSATIPAATGVFDIPFAGGTAFTYTGGALYVAFDYQNIAGTLATTNNNASCNTSLAAGFKGAWTTGSTVPLVITPSNWRPETRLGKPVSCARPTNLKLINQTLTSLDLTFDVASGSTVELEYGLNNFVQGTGTTILNAVSPVTISSLPSGTIYQFYVRKDCGAGSTSLWNKSGLMNTLFTPADTDYNTSFEASNVAFNGWKIGNTVATTNDWQIGAFGVGALVQNGNNTIYSITPASSATVTAANNWLLSRGVNLTAGVPVTVSYYISNYKSTTPAVATGTTSYKLTVGDAQTVVAQTTTLATETGISAAAYAFRHFNFTPTTTGVHYFGFQNISPANAVVNSTHAILLDNFTVSTTLGVNESLINKFEVYPNPIENVVSISNTENIQVNSISISDLNGRIVKEAKYEAVSTIQMNVSDLASGVYMMTINSDKGSSVKKIVKQ